MSRSLVKPAKLPLAVRRVLKVQCDGEWDRVTDDGAGGYVVHNNAAKAAAYAAADPPPPVVVKTKVARKATAPKATPPKNAPKAELLALAEVIERNANTSIEPGVFIEERTEREPVFTEPEIVVPATTYERVDWDQVDVESTAFALMERCRDGLPSNLSFTVKPDVLALYGLDTDLLEAAVRNPERVEVRPESTKKRYPILGFYRGDIMAVLGMKVPTAPAVIAAYVNSKLEPDTHHVVSGNGGGGARKESGLPNTVRQSVSRLRAEGVSIDLDGALDNVEVFYEEQSLGRVSIGRTAARTVVQSDYQRCLRKVNAIKMRGAAQSA